MRHTTLCLCARVCVRACVCVLLTTIADMICGAMSHRALAQGSGNRQQDTSFVMIAADSTSCKNVGEEGKKTVDKLDIQCHSKYN